MICDLSLDLSNDHWSWSQPDLNSQLNFFDISISFWLTYSKIWFGFEFRSLLVNFGHRAASIELEAIEVIEEQKKKMVRPILESTITKSVNRARVRHVQSEVVDFAIDEARANSMSKNGLSAEMNAKGKTTFKYYQWSMDIYLEFSLNKSGYFFSIWSKTVEFGLPILSSIHSNKNQED